MDFDKTDFEAYVGLPITEERFETFKLLYQSGCFMDWPDFLQKIQPMVDWLYLPDTECCLEYERRCWAMVSDFHPEEKVRQEAKKIYVFLRDLTMWYVSGDAFFHNECVEDYIVDILQDLDGVRIYGYGAYSSVELKILPLGVFCNTLLDLTCHTTGRPWKDEMSEVERNLVDHGWDYSCINRWYTRKKEIEDGDDE